MTGTAATIREMTRLLGHIPSFIAGGRGLLIMGGLLLNVPFSKIGSVGFFDILSFIN